MTKTIKTLQWNIGGGKVRQADGDVSVLASYNTDGLDSIIALIKEVNPDIITLQEIHSNDQQNQVEVIANAVGLPYYISDFYADSHIEEGQRLGQGIISRYPISDHQYAQFQNPHYEVIWEDGSTAISHDKGVTACNVDTGDGELVVKTLHLIPFRRFDIDPESDKAADVLSDVQTKVAGDAVRLLIQGDFNLDYSTLRAVLPTILTDDVQEVTQDAPTTPKGRKLDHVIFRGIQLEGSSVRDTVLTDHYPVITTFKI
ncbi:MAG TPA: endonuclease/exonuclease/phosphatase family protein [Candidatus Saccharimonadales bacterium]|nr:endonuclease/exonuclease/phosphatase family protein [Candidatus Saccharimonadales bacterium]